MDILSSRVGIDVGGHDEFLNGKGFKEGKTLFVMFRFNDELHFIASGADSGDRANQEVVNHYLWKAIDGSVAKLELEKDEFDAKSGFTIIEFSHGQQYINLCIMGNSV